MSSREVDASHSVSPADPQRCVLCGEPNDCALAREEGASNEPCWCTTEIFPKSLVVSVARERGQTECICRSCLDKQRSQEREAALDATADSSVDASIDAASEGESN